MYDVLEDDECGILWLQTGGMGDFNSFFYEAPRTMFHRAKSSCEVPFGSSVDDGIGVDDTTAGDDSYVRVLEREVDPTFAYVEGRYVLGRG